MSHGKSKRWRTMAAAFAVLVVLIVVLTACGKSPPTPAKAVDLNPPSLNVVSPKDQGSLQGLVALKIQASDDVDVSSVEYSVDGSQFASLGFNSQTNLYEATVDTTSLFRGVHYITVIARDARGNATQATVAVTVDNPPTVAIISPAGGEILQGAVTLRVQASDDQGLPGVEYSVDGGTFQPLGFHSATGYYEGFIDTQALSGGSHTITVRAMDATRQSAQAQVTGTVDNMAPVVAVIGPTERTLRGTVTLQVQATDDLALSDVQYALDGGPFKTLSLNRSTGYYEAAIDTTALRGGSHSVAIHVSDSAGHAVDIQIAMEVNNPPSVGIVNLSHEMTLQQDAVTLQIQAEDDLHLSAVEYKLDDDAYKSATLNSDTGYYEAAIAVPELAGGSHTIAVRARDDAGQTSGAQIRVTVDNIAPIVALVSPAEGSVLNGTVKLRAEAKDDLALLAVEYSVDAGAFRRLGLSGEADVYEGTIDTTALAGGTHSIIIRAMDRAGQTAQVPLRIEVDNPPNLDIVGPSQDEILQGIVTLRVRAKDDLNIQAVEYALDGTAFAALRPSGEVDIYQGAIDTTALAGGIHSIILRATDSRGQRIRLPISVSVDNAPSLAISGPIGDTVLQGTVTLTVRAIDDIRVKTVEYALDGGDFAALSLNGVADIYEAIIDTTTLAGGSHSIMVRAIDGRENTVQELVNILVDNPPSLDILDPTDKSLLRGTVTLQVQAIDDLGVDAVEFALGEGGFKALSLNGAEDIYEGTIDTKSLANGDLPIVIRAVDDAGHLVELQISVTVDNPPIVIARRSTRRTSTAAPPPPPFVPPSLISAGPVGGVGIAPSIAFQLTISGGLSISASDLVVAATDEAGNPLLVSVLPAGQGVFDIAVLTVGLPDGIHTIVMSASLVGQPQTKVTTETTVRIGDLLGLA